MPTRVSPSQAKNRMTRALKTILDPPPTSRTPIWEYFAAECAYCGRALDRAARFGDIDHADADGGNHLGNLVLACPRCNGDEKRDTPWDEFLDLKVTDSILRERRRQKIINWMAMHPRAATTIRTPAIEAKVLEIMKLIDDFGTKCAELRVLVQIAEVTGRDVPNWPDAYVDDAQA